MTFPGPWEAGARLDDKGSLESKGKLFGGWERRRRRVRRAGRKLQWAPICSCPFKSAKSLTMRGTDQWTKTGRG